MSQGVGTAANVAGSTNPNLISTGSAMVTSMNQPKRSSSAGPKISSNNVSRSQRKLKASHKGDSVDSAQDPTRYSYKARLHHLFDQIEKEFDIVVGENIALKDRVDALEEVILGSPGAPNDATSKVLQQKLSVSNVKRDSMATASQLSQKIKSTYKLKTSGRIFNKTQSNMRCHLLAKYEWHKDGVWFVSTMDKYNRLYIATASADGSACISELNSPGASSCPQLVYMGHQGCSVNCIRFHPNYDLMLTAAGDCGAHIWRPTFNHQRSSEEEGLDHNQDEVQTIKQCLVELTGHNSVVISCDWFSTVDRCVTASWDRTANIYDINTGELVVQLIGHDSELTDVTAHGSAPLIVTSSHDTTFRLWDFRESIHSVCVFQGHTECVTSAAFLGPDKVISGADDRTVKIWDLKNMRSPLTSICVESPINKLGVSQNHNIIAIPLENRHIRLYDVNGNRVCRLPRNHHDRMVTCVAFAPSPSTSSTSGSTSATAASNIHLFTCGFDRRVCWWSVTPNDHKS